MAKGNVMTVIKSEYKVRGHGYGKNKVKPDIKQLNPSKKFDPYKDGNIVIK